jgi:conjugal transfer/type IV secretion protein DotA/TraY
MLGSIFGKNFIDAFISGASPANAQAQPGNLAPVLMGGISSIAFSLAIVIASCLLLTALLNSAQDGEAFGSGSSKATIVMRFLFSWLMLLPTPSGYSIIQVVLMGFVLWSNGSTNKLYQDVIKQALFSTTGLSGSTSQKRDIWGVRSTTIQALRQIHCVHVLNAEYYQLTPKTNVWLGRPVGGNNTLNVPAGWQENPIGAHVAGVYLYGDYSPAYGLSLKDVKSGDITTFDKVKFKYTTSDLGKEIGNESSALCGMRTLTLERYDTQTNGLIKSIENGDDKDKFTISGDLKKAVGLNADEQRNALNAIMRLNQSIQAKKYNFMMELLMEVEQWYIDQQVNPYASNYVGQNPFSKSSIASLDKLTDKHIDKANSIVTNLLTTSYSSSFGEALNQLSSMLVGQGWTQAASIRQRILGFQQAVQKANSAQMLEFTEPQLNEAIIDSEQGEAVFYSIVTGFNSWATKVVTQQSWNMDLRSTSGNSVGLTNESDGAEIERSAENYVSNVTTFFSDTQANIAFRLLHGGDGPGNVGNITKSSSVNPLALYGDNTDVIGNMQLAGEYMMLATASAHALKFGINTSLLVKSLAPLPPIVDEMKNSRVEAVRVYFNDTIYPLLGYFIAICTLLGIYLAVVIPAMPTIFFTTAVVAWFIHIIQAMAGLPLWSLMHMIPERTFAGSQTQGYVTVIALFLRPVLTLVGLWFGFILANPILFYVTDAFWGSQLVQFSTNRDTSIGAVVFGFITFAGWMTAYCTLILSICYMIFGLCSQLPNSVLEWLGSSLNAGNWGESNAKEASGKIGETYNKSPSVGGGISKSPERPKNNGNDNPSGDGGNTPPGGGAGGSGGNTPPGGGGGSTTYSGSTPANGLTQMPVSRSLAGGNTGGTGGATGGTGGATGSTGGSTGGKTDTGSTNAGGTTQIGNSTTKGATVVGGQGANSNGATPVNTNTANLTSSLNKAPPKGMTMTFSGVSNVATTGKYGSGSTNSIANNTATAKSVNTTGKSVNMTGGSKFGSGRKGKTS